MTPLEWLVLLTVQLGVLVVVLLAWFDLSQSVQDLGRRQGLSRSSNLEPAEALPEAFTVTEGEAARVEAAQMAASEQRGPMPGGRSERNWSRAR